MLAYTAWDGLQTIARQCDADLTLVSDDRIELVPHRHGFTSCARQAVGRIAFGFAGLVVASALFLS